LNGVRSLGTGAKVLRYEDRPSKMLGTGAVMAIYADKREVQVYHGTAPDCAREAARLNELLAASKP